MDTKTLRNILEIEQSKTILLTEIIAWLKAKDLWEECQRCCTVKLIEATNAKSN